MNVTTSFDLNGDGITGDWVNEQICRNVACQGFDYSRNSVRQLSTADANRLRALFGLDPIASFEKNPSFWNVDVTVRKRFTFKGHSLAVALEAFNLFNTKQYNQPETIVDSDLFGKYTSVIQPRTAQVGVHYSF